MIKRAWPAARLRWLVNPEWAPLLEGNPAVDELILFPRRELVGLLNVPRQIQWLRTLRTAYSSDLVLDFQGLLRSAIAGRACRRPAGGLLIGFTDAREGARFFYDPGGARQPSPRARRDALFEAGRRRRRGHHRPPGLDAAPGK